MIPYPYESLFNQDSVDKQLTITDNNTINLGNADIYNESFELEEHLMDGEDIEIGSCYSGIVKFTTSCLSVLKDMVLDFSMVLDNHTTDPFEIGQYKVYSDKYTADRTKKDVVCYDALYEVLNANVMDWYNTLLPDLETTVTLKQFRDSFFLHFGITQETITLDNDTMAVEKTVGGATLSGALVLKAICASNGCFGKINRQGNFEYFYLSNSASPTHLADGGKYITAEWEDYDVSLIDKLIIRADEEDVGVTIGTGNNVYIMQDNFLLLGKSSADLATIGQNIYNRICNIAYKPCEIEVKGNLCFEIGDEVSFEPNNGTRFSTFILNRVYKGIQAQRDTYIQEGNETRDSYVNSLDDELKRLRGKTNKLTRTVEETVSELADFETDVASQFIQTASEISAKVDKINGTSGDSMSWVMNATTFDIQNNGTSVLKVTSAGSEINGVVKATSGYIGSDTTNGLTIYSDGLRRGGGSGIGGDDGMYLGTDGFYVANSRNDKIQLEVSSGSGSSNMNPSILIERDKTAGGYYLKDIQIGSNDCITVRDWELDVEHSIRRELNTTVISSSGISFKKNKVDGITIDNNKLSGNSLDFSREDNVAIDFRPNHASYHTTISYQTSGNEACVFATKNAVTSFIFANGEDSITNHSSNRWQSLTPALQMKNGKVAIGKLIPSGTTPTDSLDVAGNTKLETLNSLPPNTYMGQISEGNSIINVLKNTAPVGISLWQTQTADDSPTKGTVSCAMICKHTSTGAYSYVYHFNQGGQISYCATGNPAPDSLIWHRIVKPDWNTSGNWHYYRDAQDVYHLHYRSSSTTFNFNGTLGGLKYRTDLVYINFPITLTNVYSINVTPTCSTDLCGINIHSFTNQRVVLWLWGASSGNHDVSINIDVVST